MAKAGKGGSKLKVVLVVLVVLIALGVFAGGGSGSNESASSTPSSESTSESAATEQQEQEAQIEYQQVTLQELGDALEGNALNAKNTYENQYIEFTGYLSNIDSDGAYITVDNGDPLASLSGYSVQCFIKGNDDVLSVVTSCNTGDTLLVRGKITSVGEILGYSLDIDSIEKQ